MSGYVPNEFRDHPDPYPDSITWRGYGVRAIDGDTIVFRPDQGFEGTTHSVRVRVIGVDTPEMVGGDAAAGRRARDRVAELVEGQPLRVITYTSGDRRFSGYRKSFERYLADVYLFDGAREVHSLAEILIAEGLGADA